jgi:asparagine synthase (glutamine-hydrolysing)
MEENGPIEYREESVKDIPRLDIDHSSLGNLLDAGVIPTPSSPFKNLYVLNAGDSMRYDTESKTKTFSSDFAYRRYQSLGNEFNRFQFENKLIKSLQRVVNPKKTALLFLSAGKDSAAIACALREMDFSKEIHCITYRAKGQDESAKAQNIAKKLNLSHEVIDIDNYKVSYDQIESFFTGQLIPSLDLCSTVYLHCGLHRYKGSTIIDGSGNDLFIGHIPSRQEFRASKLQGYVPYLLKNCAGMLRCVHPIFMIGSKTRAEMVGLWSFLTSSPLADDLLSYKDRRQFWQLIDKQHSNLDYIDTRASLRGRYIDQEKFIRKIKNAAAAYGLFIALPWTDPELADYCYNLDDLELFDREKLINKLLLRNYLSKKLGIDYFSELKYNFSYDYKRFVDENIDCISDVILSNELFEMSLTRKVYYRAKKVNNYGLIYQLFLLLAWHKFSRYINK